MKNPSKILIVEDDPILQKVYGNLLDMDEYELVFVPDGNSALEQAESLVPDLIILDLMLPGQSGIDVCLEIRAHAQLCHVPVIMITAQTDNESRMQGLEAGVDEFIGKPFNKHELRMRVRNVTQLNRYRLLLNEQSKFQDVLEAAPDGIAIIDPEGRLILANRTLVNMAQRSVGDPLKGADFFKLLSENSREASRGRLLKTLEDPTLRATAEADLKTDSGNLLPVELSACFFFWEEQPSIQINIRDVSAKKDMERQFFRMQRLQSIGTLAGGIAHDLCNALTPIQLASEMAMKTEGSQTVSGYLNTISRSANRGTSLIRQILAFARGEESEHRLLRPKYIVLEIDRIIRDTFPQSIEINREFGKDIASVQGDATQLTQILMNLCVNARDAMPNGGSLKLGIHNRRITEATELVGGAVQPGDHVVLSVEDSGTGIPPQIIDKVFDPFFTTKETGKGTGLGLSSTLGLVRGHDGALSIVSTPGKGTRFEIFLPSVAEDCGTETDDADVSLPNGSGQTVLIVDDDVEIRSSLNDALSTHGYSPLITECGPAAVAALATHTHEVKIAMVDRSMPDMTGLQTAAALHRIAPALPIILMTEVALEEVEDQATLPSNLHSIVKPFPVRGLLETLEEALRCQSSVNEPQAFPVAAKA